MSSSQLTFTFLRGVAQPSTRNCKPAKNQKCESRGFGQFPFGAGGFPGQGLSCSPVSRQSCSWAELWSLFESFRQVQPQLEMIGCTSYALGAVQRCLAIRGVLVCSRMFWSLCQAKNTLKGKGRALEESWIRCVKNLSWCLVTKDIGFANWCLVEPDPQNFWSHHDLQEMWHNSLTCDISVSLFSSTWIYCLCFWNSA